MSAERRDGFVTSGSHRISAVILDYGQVLARCPTVEEFGRMAQMFHVSFELFYKLWEASRGPYDRGDFTAEEYWLRLASQTNTLLDAGQIEILRKVEIEIWAHTNADMLDWVGQLRAAGMKTALLSNMPADLAKHVRANCNWMDNFTFTTLSAEVRLIKPDPAIYAHTLQGLGVLAEEALFVDDRESNVEAARSLGISTILFRSIAQLKDDLKLLHFSILPTTVRSDSGGANTADRLDGESKFSALL